MAKHLIVDCNSKLMAHNDKLIKSLFTSTTYSDKPIKSFFSVHNKSL